MSEPVSLKFLGFFSFSSVQFRRRKPTRFLSSDIQGTPKIEPNSDLQHVVEVSVP